MTAANVQEGLPRPRGSVWEEDLLGRLEAHLQEENRLLDSYAELAETSAHRHVRYLGSLLLEDEVRHHRTFDALKKALLSDIEFREVEGSVPRLEPAADDEGLLERAEDLLKFEEEDLKGLRALAKQLRPVKRTTLWALLVEMMELDTEKHIRMLTFIIDEAKHT